MLVAKRGKCEIQSQARIATVMCVKLTEFSVTLSYLNDIH